MEPYRLSNGVRRVGKSVEVSSGSVITGGHHRNLANSAEKRVEAGYWRTAEAFLGRIGNGSGDGVGSVSVVRLWGLPPDNLRDVGQLMAEWRNVAERFAFRP